MALLVTIFLLVLVSQILSWIGSSVLQEFVSNPLASVVHNSWPSAVLFIISTYLPLQADRPPARTQDNGMVHKSAIDGYQRSRPFCEMGETQEERRQRVPGP